jgi:hypothetical protein
MGRGKRRFSTKRAAVTLEMQRFHMMHRFPTLEYHRDGKRATWRGSLRPRDDSQLYHVTVRYSIDDIPQVRITSPPLAERAPHVYPDGSLCLYWPDEWRWQPTMLLAETIVPWVAHWLLFYELWLDTGEWLGPSSPHGVQPPARGKTPPAA